MLILKVSYNGGGMSKKQGVELGPDKIASYLTEIYLKENGIMPVFDFLDISVNNMDASLSHKAMAAVSKDLNRPAIAIGGDHSITYSLFKGFSTRFSRPGIIVFDAHPDSENNFSPPSHEDYLRVLIEEGIVKPENIILVGFRNSSPNELAYLKKRKIKRYDMKEFAMEGHDVCDAVMSAARAFEALYVSIDIDVLDPAFAPGTGYLEPGGFTSRELIHFIQRIRLLSNFKMADVVEVNPSLDLNDITSRIAAKLVVEMS